jgi:iron complex transport system substrate-binding protein
MNHRIVSLIPSATEIVCRLGERRLLVGRSHECDFPEDVRSLPICCQSAVDPDLPSRALDREVKTRLHAAVSIFRVLPEVLESLRPTVIITQTQCDVCAISLAEVEQTVCKSLSSRPRLIACQPQRLDDIWREIALIAAAIGVSPAGEALLDECQTGLSRLSDQTRTRARPRVACLEWLDPLMAGGNWVPELVEAAGGDNLFGAVGRHSPWMEWDELIAADPDVIVLLPCGFGIERCRREMQVLKSDRRWNTLSAVQNRQVYLTDGNRFFNRPGPRVLESAEILAQILHPEIFPPAHHETGWVKWQE